MSISSLKTGLFFGTDTGNTEEIADKISEALSEHGCEVEMKDIADSAVSDMEEYDFLILGIPTWDFGGIQGEWEDVEDDLKEVNVSGKIVALYGLGDQFGYSDYFLDAMGWLHEYMVKAGAKVIGHWSTEGYDFDASRAANEDKTMFCGLGIDEDQQFELTDERISGWVAQLLTEIEQVEVA